MHRISTRPPKNASLWRKLLQRSCRNLGSANSRHNSIYWVTFRVISASSPQPNQISPEVARISNGSILYSSVFLGLSGLAKLFLATFLAKFFRRLRRRFWLKTWLNFFAASGGVFYYKSVMELKNSGRLRPQFWLKNVKNVAKIFRRLRRRFWLKNVAKLFRRFAAILAKI